MADNVPTVLDGETNTDTTKTTDTTVTDKTTDKVADKTTDTVDKTTTTTTDTKPSAAWAAGEREALAATIEDEKEREKFLARLNRFPSKAEMAKTIREQDKLFASGKVKNTLPEKPTEAELTQYRKDNGIPETFDKYDLNLGDGLVIGEDDKPLLEVALKAGHAENLTPRQMQAMVRAHYKVQEQVASDFIANQTQLKNKTTDALNQEWGAEFRPTTNAIAGLLAQMPNGVGELLGKAQLPNGDVALNNIDVLRGLAQIARQINPTGVVPRGDGGNVTQSVDDELASFAKMRKENMAGWHKRLDLKAREIQLLEFKEQQGRRRA